MVIAGARPARRACMYSWKAAHASGKKSEPHEHGSCCRKSPPPPGCTGGSVAYRSMRRRGIVSSMRRGVYSEMPSRLEGARPPPPPSAPSAYTYRSSVCLRKRYHQGESSMSSSSSTPYACGPDGYHASTTAAISPPFACRSCTRAVPAVHSAAKACARSSVASSAPASIEKVTSSASPSSGTHARERSSRRSEAGLRWVITATSIRGTCHEYSADGGRLASHSSA